MKSAKLNGQTYLNFTINSSKQKIIQQRLIKERSTNNRPSWQLFLFFSGTNFINLHMYQKAAYITKMLTEHQPNTEIIDKAYIQFSNLESFWTSFRKNSAIAMPMSIKICTQSAILNRILKFFQCVFFSFSRSCLFFSL